MSRYCPDGDGVFDDWVDRCPDCGRPLLDAPPDRRPTPPEDDPVVPLTTAPNEALAQMLAQVLLDEGIRTVVKPRGPGYGAWASVATFEHELFVLKSQLERARQIVDELEASAATDLDDGWDDPEDG